MNQLCHNLLFRGIEYEILPFCVQNDIQVIVYSPLMQGLTLCKWMETSAVPIYRARTRHFNSNNKGSKSRHGEPGHEELLFKTLTRLKAISERTGISLLDLSLAYPLHKKGISCVIAGATKLTHVTGNAKAGEVRLSDILKAELYEATNELKEAMGPNCDLWQGTIAGGSQKNDSRIE